MGKYTLAQVYSLGSLDSQRVRLKKLCADFEDTVGCKPTRLFSASGRTELGGNHTDHNCGCVLAAGVSLDVIAAVRPTDDGIITVTSEGFGVDRIDTSDLEIKQDELGSSAALIRGVAAGFARRGLNIGGFTAYSTSNVLKGSGLSSSAAFEVIIGAILNGLYNAHSVSDIEIAKISQYAENVYFGKPSGLMDQMACSVGGVISVDFESEADPKVQSLKLDLESSGYSLCIVDTKGDHADLTPDYAAIPSEMKAVAGVFGKRVLRQVDRKEFDSRRAEVRKLCGDRAYLRALHFYDENRRVELEAEAIARSDTEAYLKLVNESGMSSLCWLQNIFPCSQPQNQGLSVGLYAAKKVLGDRGACRVHGGGFAGTIQAYVPFGLVDSFKAEMEGLFGEGSCHILGIRNVGGAEIDLSEV